MNEAVDWMKLGWRHLDAVRRAVERDASAGRTVVRRPVVCGDCGAPVTPLAERCVFCKAWLEVRQ